MENKKVEAQEKQVETQEKKEMSKAYPEYVNYFGAGRFSEEYQF